MSQASPSRCPLTFVVFTSALITWVLAAPPSASGMVLHAIPADAICGVYGRPLGELEVTTTAPSSTSTRPGPDAIETLLDLLTTTGVLSGQGQVYADITGCLPLLARHEFAVALLDVSGTYPPSTSPTASQPSFRLDDLQAAVVLRTNGQNVLVLAALDRIIGRYTNNAVASLTTQRSDGYEGQRLVDQRMPGWAIWEWAALDDLFVVTFGAGAMQRVANAYRTGRDSLAEDAWLRRAESRCETSHAWFSVLLNYRRAERRLPEATMARIRAVVGAMGNAGIDREIWTIGLRGREWTVRRFYHRGEREVFIDYTSERRANPDYRRRIPPAAAHVGVLHLPMRKLIENVAAAVLAGQKSSKAQAMRRWWASLEAEQGVDIDGDILSRLGNDLIIFDYPPHPLRIPLAVTLAAPIREPERVRAAVDAACTAWERRLSENRRSPLLAMSVRHADDGIWYLQAGIVGPALKVTDGYIVLSWSPQALREALAVFDTTPP